jgi:pimeloyl-ACP methyl ester carboxylesterase/DNA-binding CsgD family transcriptional regulator
MSSAVRQRIRYVRASDGVNLAWAEVGSGPLLVKAANWLTHLNFDLESPVWRHWIEFFSRHFRFVRYDERGCGLTDWNVSDLSTERWIADLETIVDAAGASEPFALLGISHGSAVAIGYAVRHPERLSHLILYGGYAAGYVHRGNPDALREYQTICDLLKIGWEKENPAFRQVFTSRFVPGGTQEQIAWFNDLCRKTTSSANAYALMQARARLNVEDLLEQVRTPTLVIHARQDEVCPFSAGRHLAARIPNAQLVALESPNHVLLEHEPAWSEFQRVILDFLGTPAPAAKPFESLSPREREVLALITEGLANAVIADRLAISEKTVRNHVSSVFDKLGVWSRAQAIVFARDHGFRG